MTLQVNEEWFESSFRNFRVLNYFQQLLKVQNVMVKVFVKLLENQPLLQKFLKGKQLLVKVLVLLLKDQPLLQQQLKGQQLRVEKLQIFL